MTSRIPEKGEVIAYPYLWRREQLAGETEGRKDRPVCLTLSVQREGGLHIYLLAITSKSPQSDQLAIEIPQLELARAGLSTDYPSWIILDEYNRDVLEDTFYLDVNEPPLGSVSQMFLKKVQHHLLESITQGATEVDRS